MCKRRARQQRVGGGKLEAAYEAGDDPAEGLVRVRDPLRQPRTAAGEKDEHWRIGGRRCKLTVRIALVQQFLVTQTVLILRSVPHDALGQVAAQLAVGHILVALAVV